jgi:general stress protein YciG
MKKHFLLLLSTTCVLAGLALAQNTPSRQEQGKDAAPPAKQRSGEGSSAAPAQPAQDASKRGSKLSPEERKELRQQIHEAGHELYPRKRSAP